jgi:hypothetical protein
MEMEHVDGLDPATVHRPTLIPFHHRTETARLSEKDRMAHARFFAGRRQSPLNRKDVAANAVLKRCALLVGDGLTGQAAGSNGKARRPTEQDQRETQSAVRFHRFECYFLEASEASSC